MIINKVVFDLDSHFSLTDEKRPPQFPPVLKNPVKATDEADTHFPVLQELAMLDSMPDNDPLCMEQLSVSDASSISFLLASENTTDGCRSRVTDTTTHLEFESRFESGNLRKAIQVSSDYSLSSPFSHLDVDIIPHGIITGSSV